MLADAIRTAARRAHISVTPDAVGEREPAWGRRLDVREIASFGADAECADQAMAAYVAKYATKSADASGTLDRALFCRPCQGRGATLLPHGTPLPCTACVNQHLIPGLGNKKLAKLTAKDVRTWLNQLRTTCQCCARAIDAHRDQPRCCAAGACCSKRLSPLTLAYIHSVLKSALEHAVREEEITRNVARNVRTGIPRPRRFEPLTADEARQFLATVRNDRLFALCELALRAGLRKGELLGLQWEDLDLRTGAACIRRTLQRTQTGGLTALSTKTRASERRIALPCECIHALKEHREVQEGEREAAADDWRNNGLVFSTTAGGPTDPANLNRSFRALLSRAGLRRIRLHDLRHSTATLLLEQGVELIVIKELLGHAHIGVTATVYAHVRLRLQRDAIDLLGRTLHNPSETANQPDAGDALPSKTTWAPPNSHGGAQICGRCMPI
ncbi:replication initiator [Streptomyces sp. NPDC059134]|uniref:tyrosine-type recombinase/integrase n=1 Tax=Streptomyces sp. NPDC059134 TaxID=3346738 RepID=UPI0036983BF1